MEEFMHAPITIVAVVAALPFRYVGAAAALVARSFIESPRFELAGNIASAGRIPRPI
jgi:hypothetical protein